MDTCCKFSHGNNIIPLTCQNHHIGSFIHLCTEKRIMFGITHFKCTMGRGDRYCPLPPPFLRWNIVASPGPHQLTCQVSLITKYFHMTLKTDVAAVLGRNQLTGKSLVPYPGKYRVRKPCPHNQLGSFSPTCVMHAKYRPFQISCPKN